MKPIDQMNAAELCEAIKTEGARLGVRIQVVEQGATISRGKMILWPLYDDFRVQVYLSWQSHGQTYDVHELREAIRRWMSLRGEG